jgi:hypothetical protein
MGFAKLPFLFLLLLPVSVNLFSQKIFREGYIIKETGELLTGLVKFSPDNKSPASCFFKNFDIAFEVKYKPTQLKGFGYKYGKNYESLNIKGKTSFYETLVTGEITVYKKGLKYYLKKSDQVPVEVIEGKNLWNSDGKQKEFDNLYDLLKFLTEGTGVEIKDKPDLNRDLVPVITAFNKISGKPCHVYNRTVSERELADMIWKSGANRNKFGVETGINDYILRIKPSGYTSFIPESQIETDLMVGFSYKRVVSKKTDRFSIRTGLFFIKRDFYDYSERTLDSYRFSRDDAFFGISGVKMPLLFQYSFNEKRLSPFINTGATGMYFINKNYSHRREVEVQGSDIITSEDNDMIFYPGEISATFGAGITYRIVNWIILSIEGRFEYGTGIFNTKYPAEVVFSQHSYQPTVVIGVTF